MLQTSSTQDGGHVRRGYSVDDIRYLARAAGLEVLRIDGVTRSHIDHIRRRYEWRGVRQIANNCYLAAVRTDADAFLVGCDLETQQDSFLCLGALLRVPA